VNPDYQKLLARCLKLLSLRPRSRKEIEDYLAKKTSDSELTNLLINKLTDLKLIDDAAFTRWLIESRSKSRGSRFIQQELKSKGIEVEKLPLQTDETITAEKLLLHKSALWGKLSYRDYYSKAWRYLSYRGFSSEIIAKAVKNAYNRGHVN
jgi:regulatory protein